MSSGIGGGISAGVARGGGGGTHRKNPKKFGKNLNKLTKAPAAPPVPISVGSGGSSSFPGSSSSRNGLLLLSTKSKSSSSGGGGLLAQLGGQEGGEAKKTAAPAWGMGEKNQKEPAPTPSLERTGQRLMSEKGGSTKVGEGNEKPELVLDRRNSLAPQQRPLSVSSRSAVSAPQQKPLPSRAAPQQMPLSSRAALQQMPLFSRAAPQQIPLSSRVAPQRVPLSLSSRSAVTHSGTVNSVSRSAVSEMVGSVNRMNLGTADSQKTSPGSGVNNDVRFIDKPSDNVAQLKESITQPIEKTDSPARQTPPEQKKVEIVKDDQVEYMSKLAKERAEKLRSEEEARMAAQKERAAVRLRDLEEKRLEEKKKQQQIKSLARKELSRPSNQVILEPLGKARKDTLDPFSPNIRSKTLNTEKRNGGRTLYDPDRPFSSLVGGKKIIAASVKKEERPRGNTQKNPVHGPPVPHVKQSLGQSYADNKKEDPAPPVHMVKLSNLGELDRGGRGEGHGGPRMLFDPNSGSMVAVQKRREEPKSTKKTKPKGPQKSPSKRPEEASKASTLRSTIGTDANETGSDVKLLRGKQGKGSRKDEPLPLQQRNKKALENKGRQSPRKRLPRTCGVLYKMDKSGNFVNVDGCEPDKGYGSHHTPGGRVKNPGAQAKLSKQKEEKTVTSAPASSKATATEGFSYRNDPGFLEHQTNFESQQQKILEDAWASLVENEDQEEAESNEKRVEEDVLASKSGEDDYAAALAISPSMMGLGLNFDANNDTIDSVMLPSVMKGNTTPSKEEPIDFAKFAMQAASSTSPANPFSPLGVSGAGLWGGGTSSATSTSYVDLGALTGWDATPFGETDTAAAGSSGLPGSSSQASKLHLWGSSALDGGGLGAFGNNSDSRNGAD